MTNRTVSEAIEIRNRQRRGLVPVPPKGPRPLYQVADEIRRLWGPKMYFGAVPYVDAMADLRSIDDSYGLDSAKSIVLYFLANAATWRGEDAKRIKAELKSIAGVK